MERIVWNEKSVLLRSLVDDPSIEKPILAQTGGKTIVIGAKINGDFILASPCKISGDRFEILEQEIVLSNKHSGLWRVISITNQQIENHIHRLTTKDIENIYLTDLERGRTESRSYICIREVEAFEVIVRNSNDPNVEDGRQIERRVKVIEENVEFEILDIIEVEYTPSEGERTSHDFVIVSKSVQSVFLKLLLPGVVDEVALVRNRVVRALHCRTKNESHKRRFLLEVNLQPSEIRPIASKGSTELRYLHSTRNLYDIMSHSANDSMIYVKLIRGDPPIKAVRFDGYMIMKTVLNGDQVPICRVSDLELTLISPNLPLRVKLPNGNERYWRSLSEVRAAEVECMQLQFALLVGSEPETSNISQNEPPSKKDLEFDYNEQQQRYKNRQRAEIVKEHLENCERIFKQNENRKESEMKTNPQKTRVSSSSNNEKNRKNSTSNTGANVSSTSKAK